MTSVSIFKKLGHQASTADKTLIHIAIAMEIKLRKWKEMFL